MISEAEIAAFNARSVPTVSRSGLWGFITGSWLGGASRQAGCPSAESGRMPDFLERGALTPEGVAGALAVADTEPWWRAVHQVIDDLEWETIRAARDSTLQPTACVSHVAAGEGLDMLRKRLKSLREQGLRLPNEGEDI
jgi:hypothetical protein